MADNFDFDNTIFNNDGADPAAQQPTPEFQPGYEAPVGYESPVEYDGTAVDAFDDLDSYADQDPSADNAPEYTPADGEPDEPAEPYDKSSSGIGGFIGSIGTKGKICLIVAVVLLFICIIMLASASRKAKSKKPSTEPVSVPEIEQTSDIVVVPTEPVTMQFTGGAGTYTVDTDNSTLALRPNASTEYDVITRIPDRTVIEVLFVDDFSNEGESWGYVVYDGQAGWVNMQFLAPGAQESASAVSTLG